MAQVLLYPKKGGTGGANPAEPWAFPQKIANKLIKSGAWSNVPDVANEKVAVSLIEKVQNETREKEIALAKEREKIAQERADLAAMQARLEEMQKQLQAGQLQGEEQVKKPGRPAKTAEV